MSDEFRSALENIIFDANAYKVPIEDVVGQIGRALKDAGYILPGGGVLITEDKLAAKLGMLTPKQWVARFKAELETERPYMSPGEFNHAMKAAERATK